MMFTKAHPASVGFLEWTTPGEKHVVNELGRDYWERKLGVFMRAWRRDWSRAQHRPHQTQQAESEDFAAHAEGAAWALFEELHEEERGPIHGRIFVVTSESATFMTQVLRQLDSFEHSFQYSRPWSGCCTLEGDAFGNNEPSRRAINALLRQGCGIFAVRLSRAQVQHLVAPDH